MKARAQINSDIRLAPSRLAVRSRFLRMMTIDTALAYAELLPRHIEIYLGAKRLERDEPLSAYLAEWNANKDVLSTPDKRRQLRRLASRLVELGHCFPLMELVEQHDRATATETE